MNPVSNLSQSEYPRLFDYLKTLQEGERQSALRLMARTDLYFLLRYLLHRPDVDHPWLFDRCREVQNDPNGRIDLWSRDHYKDLRCDTPIATPDGWRLHGDLSAGDTVFAIDGTPTSVIARTPTYEDNRCYRVTFSDGTSMVAGQGHLWLVMERSSRRDNYRRIRRYPAVRSTGYLAEIDHDKLSRSGSRVAVPFNWPVVLPAADLPIPPYTLGQWLGDGESASGRITSGDPQTWDEIRSDGFELSHDHGGTNAQVRTVYGMQPVLRKVGVLNNKHVPGIYLRGSESQRLALLQGLMDSDGNVTKDCKSGHEGTATFVNKNERLADGVYELATSLGMHPSKRSYRADHGLFWQVSFQAYTAMPPFRIKRKVAHCRPGQPWGYRYIAAVEPVPTEPTNCIQVAHSSGVYLAGREMVPTHNSTIITFAKTIQDILASHGEEPLPEWKGREVTCCILSHTRPIAKAFLRQIMMELESNDELKGLFPDVLYGRPEREAPRWSEDAGLIVKRQSNPKEATVEAWGLVDGQPTSRHFLLLVYDDVVTEKSVNTGEQIQKTTKAFELSDNLGTQGQEQVRVVGTRYHYADTYDEMIKRGALIPRIHPATVDGTETGEPVFLSREALDAKRRKQGPYTFSAQMLLNPTASSLEGFLPEWEHFYDGVGNWQRMNRVMLVDPAHAKKKDSDYTAIVVWGLAEDENYYLLDIVRDRLNLKQRADAVLRLHRKWRPKVVGYERYGLQADIEYIKERQKQDNYRFEITEVAGQMAKHDRIKRMMPVFSDGRIWLPIDRWYTRVDGKSTDLIEELLNVEMRPYPATTYKDCLDAMSRIFDVECPWPKPPEQSVHDRYADDRRQGSWMSA